MTAVIWPFSPGRASGSSTTCRAPPTSSAPWPPRPRRRCRRSAENLSIMPGMRIALISDLHGNELALDAVLDDATRSGADKILCLGDVATLGARPREVIARLRALG